MGGADGEVVYESLVRPTKAVSKGEFPLMKLSASSAINASRPPAVIEHKMDEFTKGLLQNSDLHIHRTRHDPVN